MSGVGRSDGVVGRLAVLAANVAGAPGGVAARGLSSPTRCAARLRPTPGWRSAQLTVRVLVQRGSVVQFNHALVSRGPATSMYQSGVQLLHEHPGNLIGPLSR